MNFSCGVSTNLEVNTGETLLFSGAFADHFDPTFIGFIHSELSEMSEEEMFKIKLEQKMFFPLSWKVKSCLESLSKCSISNINVFFLFYFSSLNYLKESVVSSCFFPKPYQVVEKIRLCKLRM